MKRLSAATLKDLPPGIRKPAYDRAALPIGMAHLGVGAFHRCHQAEFTDDALEQQFGPWGVIGVNLRPPELVHMLGLQDGLYTRSLDEDGAPSDLRVIGSLRGVVDAEHDVEPALTVLADPRIGTVTVTVTEKGYCHVPSTGALDERHPDILHDTADPTLPRSVPGVLAAALERRMQANHPVTLISCDNIPANGAILQRVVTAMAAQRSADLAAWVRDHVAFPCTMVDRIVPAATDEDRARIAAALHRTDEAGVVGEPFRQWVLEDRFATERPPWDLAGAEFVADVAGHELIKMRVLNGAQSAFATLGPLLGLTFTFEDARHPALAQLVRRMLEEETASTLPQVSSMAPQPYIEASLRRLRNRAIRHTNHQIATDSSQKIVQRLLNPLRDRLAQDRSFDKLACAVAGVIVYLAKASPALGASWIPSDPFAGTIRVIADQTGPDAPALVTQTLNLSGIFGTDLVEHPAVIEAVTRHTAGLLDDAPHHIAMTAET